MKLVPIQKSVSLPGATVSRTALVINAKATDEQLSQIGVALATMAGSVAWWQGDYGLVLQDRKGAEYRTARAAILGIDEGYWANCVMVCRFFKPSHRCEALSYSHHWEAMRAAGGAATGSVVEAKRWLKRAVEGGWSVSQLREAVNKSLATSFPPENPPPENPFAVLDEADKWAHGAATDTIGQESARALLVRWTELRAFIKRLEALAG